MSSRLNSLFMVLIMGLSIQLADSTLAWSQGVGTAKQTVSTDVGGSGPTNADGEKNADESESPIASWGATLDSAEQAIQRDGITGDALDNLEVSANDVTNSAQAFIDKFNPDRETIKTRIEELGPKPKETEEDEAIAKKRVELETQFAKFDGDIKAARLAIVRATQLKARLAKVRRDRFVRSISQRSQSVFSITLIQEFFSGVPSLTKSMRLLVKDSTSVLVQRLRTDPWKGGALAAMVSVAFLVLWYARKLFHQFRQNTYANQEESRLRKIKLALLQFLRLGVLNAAFIGFIYFALERLGLLTKNLSAVMVEAAAVIGFVFIAIYLARVFLMPRDGELRYADLSDAASKKVFTAGTIAVVSMAVLHIANQSAVILVAPSGVSIGLSAVMALVILIFSIRIMLIIAGDRADNVPSVFREKRLFRWIHLRPLIWLTIAATALALVFGYLAFAEFASVQIIVASVVLGLLWLCLEFFDAYHQNYFARLKEYGSPLTKKTGLRSESLAQMSILGFGLLKLVAILLTTAALFAPWGVRTNEWVDIVSRAFFGFQVGDLTISIASILMAVGLFVIGYIITRTLQAWLSNQFLPETRLDVGLRNSISTVLGYVGIVVAAMLAIGAMGIDLSNFAIVAGALSVGIGFGMQSIVSNFVSGLILLAERPIKAGDWVITSGGEGTVKKISVRSTEIETFERASVIVPNSTLITDPVTNWTHTSKFGRIGIAIGVGYDSEPEQVREILIETMKSHPGILGKPEPKSYFMDFGDSALMFEVRGYLSNIEDGFQTKSDLRFAIFKALKDANIEIPFPQRDINIRGPLDGIKVQGD